MCWHTCFKKFMKGKSPFLKIVLMKLTKYFLCMLILCAFNLHAHAQTYEVRGTVYDLQGRQTISGVSIITGDGLAKTVTDQQGAFSLQSAQSEGIIRVSMMGYKTEDVFFTPNKALNIQLEPSTVSLNEVRVSGYNGNKTNKETAGAVALITGDQIRSGNG